MALALFITLASLLSISAFIMLTESAPLDDKAELKLNFYAKSCPQAEQIVGQVVADAYRLNPGVGAGLIRLHFHDCFVNGCDASVLLDESSTKDIVEKLAPGNAKSLRGMEVIDDAKARLEEACPGVVSCADILAFAARDAAVNARFLGYGVPAGRRDGNVSHAADTGDLPRPSMSMDQLTGLFAKKGLSKEDMVVLSGAHSIGVAHCTSFYRRLYSFSPDAPQDPSLEPSYAAYLKGLCAKSAVTPNAADGAEVGLDSISPYSLDNAYYPVVITGRALLASDQVLMEEPGTKEMVKEFATNANAWSEKFTNAMIRMGEIGVLTGNQGQIRKQCGFVNNAMTPVGKKKNES